MYVSAVQYNDCALLHCHFPYICVCVCVCVCMYIYIYIYTHLMFITWFSCLFVTAFCVANVNLFEDKHAVIEKF